MIKKGPVRKLMEDCKKLKLDYLQSLAEFDNYRKRRDKEFEEMRKLCAESVIKDLIPVIEDFERAIKNSKENDPLYKGVKMIHSNLIRTLESHGLKRYSCLGDIFDPRRAEVLSKIERDDVDEGMVVEEFEKGYMIGNKVLKPAKVVVAKRKEGGENNG